MLVEIAIDLPDDLASTVCVDLRSYLGFPSAILLVLAGRQLRLFYALPLWWLCRQGEV